MEHRVALDRSLWLSREGKRLADRPDTLREAQGGSAFPPGLCEGLKRGLVLTRAVRGTLHASHVLSWASVFLGKVGCIRFPGAAGASGTSDHEWGGLEQRQRS